MSFFRSTYEPRSQSWKPRRPSHSGREGPGGSPPGACGLALWRPDLSGQHSPGLARRALARGRGHGGRWGPAAKVEGPQASPRGFPGPVRHTGGTCSATWDGPQAPGGCPLRRRCGEARIIPSGLSPLLAGAEGESLREGAAGPGAGPGPRPSSGRPCGR